MPKPGVRLYCASFDRRIVAIDQRLTQISRLRSVRFLHEGWGILVFLGAAVLSAYPAWRALGGSILGCFLVVLGIAAAASGISYLVAHSASCIPNDGRGDVVGRTIGVRGWGSRTR